MVNVLIMNRQPAIGELNAVLAFGQLLIECFCSAMEKAQVWREQSFRCKSETRSWIGLGGLDVSQRRSRHMSFV